MSAPSPPAPASAGQPEDHVMLHRPPAGAPTPAGNPISAPFWAGCREGELRFQRCVARGHPVFEPSTMCRTCGDTELSWEASCGRAVLYSWTVLWRPQSPAFSVPYACGIVELDEGYRMLATVADVYADELALGLHLHVAFEEVHPEWTLPYFRPLGR